MTLQAGDALALTGPNGVGKTSLLRVLAGLLQPEHGDIMLSPADPDTDHVTRVQFVSSREPLKAALTVRETLESWATVVFDATSARVLATLSDYRLEALANTPCGYLSSGQRRRLSLARLGLASVDQRPLWLLDEPTNALDAAARALLTARVTAHRCAGGMVIAATHDPLGWPDMTERALTPLLAS